MIKEIMIPVAAFAVTVTGASAFNSDMLEKIDVDLSASQISALEEVHELRESGADRDEVKTFLEEAGLDEDTMKEIKTATRELREENREAIGLALENDDYEAFVSAIEDTPLAEAINSESDFETFKEAQDLRDSGEHEAARELMEELGVERPEGHGGKMFGEHGPRGDKESGGSREGVEDRGGQRGGEASK